MSCKKNKPNSTGEFVSYFEDTTISKLMGANLATPNEVQNLPDITEIDTGIIPFFSRISGVLPSEWSIDVPQPKKQSFNNCVTWTVAYGMLSWHYRVINKLDSYNNFEQVYSPAFVYNQINNGVDSGTTINKALKFIRDNGVCEWNYMPENLVSFNQAPSTEATNNALAQKITVYGKMKILDIKKIKQIVSLNYPVAFSVIVDKGFMTGTSKESFVKKDDGRLVWKADSGKEVGGHAMLICGYDDKINAFKVLNSWGRFWGNNGYIWIDYDHFAAQVRRRVDNQPEIYWAITRKYGDPNKELIAYYPFNGNANDLSGNQNNGTIIGGVTTTTDRKNNPGSAILFNGSDGYISISPSISLNSITKNDDATFACWFKTDSWNNIGGHISKNDNSYGMHYRFLINENSTSLQVEQPTFNCTYPTLEPNRWYFFAGVKAGNTCKIYLNGQLIASGDMFNDQWGTTINSYLEIGRDAHGPVEYTHGAIDDVRIYKRALNEAEIQMLYKE